MKRILDRIPRPPGALPARAQTWLLLGLTAAIAITLLTFPGPQPKPTQGPTAPSAVPEEGGALGVQTVESAAERMRETAAQQAERRLRRELGVPEPSPDGLPPAPTPVTAGSGSVGGQSAAPGHGPSADEQIEQEERLRRYRSLRTPPLVQSSRDQAAAETSEAATGREPIEVDNRLADPESDGSSADPTGVAEEESAASANPERPTYTLHEGEFLEAVLTNRLSGDFSGPVSAMVSADVYDRTRQRLLVPRGTRALGYSERVDDWDQGRLVVAFHRLILPDGGSVSLDRSPGLNQIGETGLKDIVNRRYVSTIAVTGAVGALAGLTSAASPERAFTSRFGAARLSAGSGLAGAAERLLERYLNRMPKITIREGHRLRIYLTADLRLSAYRARHGFAGQPRDFIQGDRP